MGNQAPFLHSLMLLVLFGTSEMAHVAAEFRDKAGGLYLDGHHHSNPPESLSGKSDTAESRQLLASLHLGLGSPSPSLQALQLAGIRPPILGLGPAHPLLANPLLAQQLAVNRIGLENTPSLGAGQNIGGLGTGGLGLDALGLGSYGTGARNLGAGLGTAPGLLNPAAASALGGRPIIPGLAAGQLASSPVSELLQLAPYLSSEDWKEILGESRPEPSILNSLTQPFNVATDRKGDKEINALVQALQSLQNVSPITAGAGLPLGSQLQSPALANPLLQRLLTVNALQLANARALQMMALAREPYLAAQKRSLELTSPKDTNQRYPSSSQNLASREYYDDPHNHRRQYARDQQVSSGFIEITGKPSSSDRNYFPRRSSRIEYSDRYNGRDQGFKFPRDV